MKKIAWAIVAILFSGNAFAGGILTNTNQNIAFNRNMARDGIIGIDGVYSNPAGVVFMEDGFHLSVNWQMAFQTRTISTTNPDFALGMNNNGNTTKEFKGEANVPFIPSLQAAYNTGRWSLQSNIAITGGGGKCEFSEGIGSFESAMGAIAHQLQPLGTTGYDADCFMSGKQYYIGFSLGAAYKLTDNFSVFGGARLLVGSASYKARMNNMMVNTAAGAVPFGDFLDNANARIAGGIAQYAEGISQIEAGIHAGALGVDAALRVFEQHFDLAVARSLVRSGLCLEPHRKTLVDDDSHRHPLLFRSVLSSFAVAVHLRVLLF